MLLELAALASCGIAFAWSGSRKRVEFYEDSSALAAAEGYREQKEKINEAIQEADESEKRRKKERDTNLVKLIREQANGLYASKKVDYEVAMKAHRDNPTLDPPGRLFDYFWPYAPKNITAFRRKHGRLPIIEDLIMIYDAKALANRRGVRYKTPDGEIPLKDCDLVFVEALNKSLGESTRKKKKNRSPQPQPQ
jgi:hypothetical protein